MNEMMNKQVSDRPSLDVALEAIESVASSIDYLVSRIGGSAERLDSLPPEKSSVGDLQATSGGESVMNRLDAIRENLSCIEMRVSLIVNHLDRLV